MRPIELTDVGPPPLEVPDECPRIEAGEFEARIDSLLAVVDADWVVVYGDREHAASLIYLCNLDPRFEEALLVLGRGRRVLLLGKEDIGYVPIVPIDVDVVCCPTLSLMGIDRGGGPTVEEALRQVGSDLGTASAWSAGRRSRPVSGTASSPPSSRPHSLSTRCDRSPVGPSSSPMRPPP
jgi:hypothetical protein